MASQARLAAYKRHKGGILVLSEGEHPARGCPTDC